MSLKSRRRMAFIIGLFALATLATACLTPLAGSERIEPGKVLAWLRVGAEAGPDAEIQASILFTLRLPRIALALLAGGALGVVGAVFQAMLRNPLATPETLGVAAGGTFGAVAAMFLPAWAPWLAFSVGAFSQVQVFAFGGALLATAIIYWLARGERISALELLLAGVTMSVIFSALMLAVTYFASQEQLVNMTRWMMGGLDVTGWPAVWGVLPMLLPGVGALMLMARSYDMLAFGEELAQGRGVNVGRLIKLTFLFGSLATAAVVAAAGPIGFVGLIVPHTVRRMVGADHRLLLPCAFLAGGTFLALCDTLARSLMGAAELPVGIITALLGGPFFIHLLLRRRGGGRAWGK